MRIPEQPVPSGPTVGGTAGHVMGIDGESVILPISTEGDTDPEGYARIVRG